MFGNLTARKSALGCVVMSGCEPLFSAADIDLSGDISSMELLLYYDRLINGEINYEDWSLAYYSWKSP